MDYQEIDALALKAKQGDASAAGLLERCRRQALERQKITALRTACRTPGWPFLREYRLLTRLPERASRLLSSPMCTRRGRTAGANACAAWRAMYRQMPKQGMRTVKRSSVCWKTPALILRAAISTGRSLSA